MPDSLSPPSWGPASFDEQDLQAVLARETADGPVADLLAALRAGPVPAELYGEASAMAEFRALGLGQAGSPASTMPLEALPAGSRARPGRRAARHRVRAARRHSLRPAVLSAVAAAAVIVGAVLVTGNIVGPFRAIAHMASPSAGASFQKSSTGHPAAPRVEISSSALETTSPPSAAYSTPPAPTPGEICWAYYTGLKQPGPSAWATQVPLLEQLTKLAGSPSKVYQYCLPYVKDRFRDAQAPEHPEQGNQGNGGTGQPATAPAISQNGSGSGTASTSPAGNGQGGSGSNP
jgi:hypothetical protein